MIKIILIFLYIQCTRKIHKTFRIRYEFKLGTQNYNGRIQVSPSSTRNTKMHETESIQNETIVNSACVARRNPTSLLYFV